MPPPTEAVGAYQNNRPGGTNWLPWVIGIVVLLVLVFFVLRMMRPAPDATTPTNVTGAANVDDGPDRVGDVGRRDPVVTPGFDPDADRPADDVTGNRVSPEVNPHEFDE